MATFEKPKLFLVKDQFLSNRDYYKDDFLDAYASQALPLSLSQSLSQYLTKMMASHSIFQFNLRSYANIGSIGKFRYLGNFGNFEILKTLETLETLKS